MNLEYGNLPPEQLRQLLQQQSEKEAVRSAEHIVRMAGLRNRRVVQEAIQVFGSFASKEGLDISNF